MTATGDPSAPEEGNVVGGPLEPCGTEPMTGSYRDGCCGSGPEDRCTTPPAR